MADSTLFRAKRGVKLTVRPHPPRIAPMSLPVWRVACLAAAAAAACNEGLRPTPTCPPGFVGICGLVTFHLPPFPPPTVPTNNSTYAYTLQVPSGRYEWVLAVWKKKGTLTTQSADSLLREVGFYRDDGDTTTHGSGIVTVDGAAADSIDFAIDFNNMHRICTYFPPCP